MKEEARQVHIAGLGDLDVAIAAQHHAHFHVQALDHAGLVGAEEAVLTRQFESARQQIVVEDLWRLRHHQFLPRQRRPDAHAAGGAAHLLHRVHHRHAHDGGAGLGRFVEHLANGFRIDERPHGVVDRHQGSFRTQGRERVLDRLLPAVAAFDGAHAPAGKLPRQHPADPLQILRAHRHYDLSHAVRSRKLAHRMNQDGRAFQQHELLAAGTGLLGGALSHTGAQARRGEYHRTFHVHYDSIVVPSGPALVMGCGSLLRTGRSCLSGPAAAACTRSSNLPKIIFPAVVWSTLVTAISMVLEIIFLALSTTTMVPSSRYATPWLYSLPSLRMNTRMVSPASTIGLSELASSLMLSTSTP